MYHVFSDVMREICAALVCMVIFGLGCILWYAFLDVLSGGHKRSRRHKNKKKGRPSK